MSKIGDFVDHHNFDSIESLLKRVRHLPDGVGFFSNETSAIWNALFQMSSNAEYDFDARHFNVVLEPTQTSLVATEMLKRHQFCAFDFRNAESAWDVEEAFSNFAKTHSSKRPLILNFSPTISDHAMAFQEQSLAEVVHVGTQYHCTNRDYIDRTLIAGMKFVPLKKIERLIDAVDSTTQIAIQRPTWIRLDMTVLAHAQGGGTGAWATGFQMADLLSAIEWWMRQAFVFGFTIGTRNIEIESLSVKSAAQIMSSVIYSHSQRRIVSSAHGKKPSEIFS